MRGWASQLKLDILTLWVVARDPATPILPKLVAGGVAAYALSPIDLIPDFIPVLGYLDDLILVPIGIWLALRLVPPPLLASARMQASAMATRPISRRAAVLIILLWLTLLGGCLWLWL
jgi:uncharacterized membrane protein YkvA (DUF1232 family)